MTARPHRFFLSPALFILHSLALFLVTGCSGSRAKLASEEVRPVSGATQRGLASWYGKEFANLPTASGEIFRPEKVSAAHRTLPLGTVVDVANEKNGRTVRVRINDRGPFVAGRVVDLSRAAAEEIGSVADGVVPVTLTVVSLGDVPAEALAKTTAAEIAPGGWSVQAGAFGNEENAKRLRDRLASRFPNPYLESFQGLLRVKFGPYTTREEAEAARDSLGEYGLAGIVVPYR